MRTLGSQQRIGRYVVEELIGRGAMGVVYRAEDPLIHRTVAVKVLQAMQGLTQEQIDIARGRFMREAQTAGGLDHPNIIRIFDVGEEGDRDEMYIIMEYISGPSLETLLQREELDVAKTAEIIGQIAAGLDAAHSRGMVHRDVKPSNILFTENGVAKIADFGITHVAESHLTRDVTQLGTPAYISPEQFSGRVLDGKADLFSLGVLCYQMLAGRRPFDGDSALAISYQVVHSQHVAVTVANPALPKALDAVMDRILAKEPSERFGSGKDFHDALVASLSSMDGVRPRAAKVTPHRLSPWWGLASTIAIVVTTLLYLSGRRSSESPAEMSVIEKSSPAGTVETKSPAKPSQESVDADGTARSTRTVDLKAGTPIASRASATRVTISLRHKLTQGTLLVSLDGAPVLREEFAKSKLTVYQTTTWDAFAVPSGRHKLTAKVSGVNGKVYRSDPHTIEFPRGRGIILRIGFDGEALTIDGTPDD